MNCSLFIDYHFFSLLNVGYVLKDMEVLKRMQWLYIVNHRKQPSLLTPLTPKLGEGGVRSAT